MHVDLEYIMMSHSFEKFHSCFNVTFFKLTNPGVEIHH